MRITTVRRLGAGLVTVPLALAGVAATPPDGCYAAIDDDPETEIVEDTVIACEKPTWVADPSGTKAGNLAVAGATAFPTLVDEEPTDSVASPAGAQSGAGYLGTSLLQLAEQNIDATGFTIKSEFTGVIDRLALTLHGVYSGYGSTGGPTDRKPFTAYISVDIDGESVIFPQSLEVDFTTDAAPTANASERFRATVTGLAAAFEDYGFDAAPDAVHEITIRVTPRYLNTEPVALFLYGTKEVPSGVVFNPVTLDPDVVTVNGY